jgi:hypothetical protein
MSQTLFALCGEKKNSQKLFFKDKREKGREKKKKQRKDIRWLLTWCPLSHQSLLPSKKETNSSD